MALLLGPIPPGVRSFVVQAVAEARANSPNADEGLNGLLLAGGPGGCSFLDADGEVWNRTYWDNLESVEQVLDGPTKVGLIAIAAERIPALAEWLPRRPENAPDCQVCNKTGWLLPPLPRLQCPECFGMGWSPRRATGIIARKVDRQ
jgi:hypothetical protein